MAGKRNGFIRTLFFKMSGLIAVVALILAGCIHDDDDNGKRGSPPASQQPDILQLGLVLSGDQEVPPVVTTASGTGSLEINLDSGAISGSITTNVANATMAHIHTGDAGENGPVLITLEADAGSWHVPANATLDATSLEQLFKGGLYVNVHSDAHSDGELRAQLLPQGLGVIRVALSGDQEIPPVTTNNSAIAAITLDQQNRTLTVHVLGLGLDDATAAHIHAGFAGEEGDPVINLQQDMANPAHWFADAAVLDDATYNRLQAAGLYINVHTPAHPEGEVRGQIIPTVIVPLTSFHVSIQTPAANANIEALPSQILLNFNIDVNAETVASGAFEILRAGGDSSFNEGNEVAINIAQALVSASDAKQVILDIAGNAGPSDVYRITIADSLMSQSGLSLDGDTDGSAGGQYQRSFSVTLPVVLLPTLSSIQAAIFTPVCTDCHGGTSPSAGMRLDAGNTFSSLVNIYSTEVVTVKRVRPRNPDRSYLIQKLEGTAAVGARMPLGGPYLSQEQINVIRQWIADGALNN